MYLRT
jgi:hypothetical protein